MTDEQIVNALDGITRQLTAIGEMTDDGYPSYNVVEGLVMIAKAIDENTAAIQALTAELKNHR